MAGFETGRLGGLIVGGLMVLAGPTIAQTMPVPSFDCATADHYVEWGICHDADLARLDAAIGERYEALLSELDPAAAAELRADQERFIADRNTFIGGTLRGEWVDAMKDDILAKLEIRLEELEAIALEAEGDQGQLTLPAMPRPWQQLALASRH